MADVLTIDGVEWEAQIGSIIITEATGSPYEFSCSIASQTGVRPLKDKEIIYTVNGTRMFGGIVTEVNETALTDAYTTALQLTVRAKDYSVLLTRRYVDITIPSGNLKAALTALASFYTPYGISLDASQPNGPTLPELVYEDKRLDELLDDLTLVSDGYMRKVSYTKVLSLNLPTSVAAPFSVTDGDGHVIGDITVEPSTTETANKVILKIGEGTKIIDDVFTGDGVTTDFTLTAPFILGWTVSNMPDNPYETLRIVGASSPGSAMWALDTATGILTREAGAPTNGNTITFTYQAQFPVRIVSDGGAAPGDVIEAVIRRPDIFDTTLGQEIADAYRSRLSASFRTIIYRTMDSGLHPGQVQTLTFPNHSLSGQCTITEVKMSHWEGGYYIYDVKLIEGTLYQGNWRDDIKTWGEQAGGAVAASGGAITIIQGVVSPSVLFLGGNELLYVQSSGPTWIAADAVRVTVDTTTRGSFNGTVRCRVRARSGTVQPRLWNVTDSTQAGIGSAVASTSWSDQSFGVTLASGSKVYELQLLPGTADVDVAGTGHLE